MPVHNRKSGTCLILGHRGSSDRYPENTMLAFRQAVSEGANGVETDVRKTADGHYVLLHDGTVDRTTDGNGPISELTLAQAKTLDAGICKGPEFSRRSDTRLATLMELLAEFRGRPVFLMLQMKLGQKDAVAVANIIARHGMLHQCFIFGHTSVIGQVKRHNPAVMVLNDGMSHRPEDLIDQATAEGWNAISTAFSKYTQENVRAATEKGLFVQGSFLSKDYARACTRAFDLGIHFILGNDCAAMSDATRRRQIKQLQPCSTTVH